MFSATMTSETRGLCKKFMSDPHKIRVDEARSDLFNQSLKMERQRAHMKHPLKGGSSLKWRTSSTLDDEPCSKQGNLSSAACGLRVCDPVACWISHLSRA